MKAAQIKSYGHADVVEVVEIAQPMVGAEQALVEVQAASLNPFDTMVREGYLKEMVPLDLPITLGGDIAGVVREVGDGVSNVAVGDIVYGQANVVAGNSGALAEYAVTKAAQLAKAPVNLDITDAASLPLIGVSALQAISEHIKLSADQKIFIHGGAGNIGSIAIELAKNIGAHVATTATGEGLKLVKELGADEVIDYKNESFADKLSDYDAVFDTVGGEDSTKAMTVLKPGGTLVSMVRGADEAKAAEYNIHALSQATQVTSEKLAELAKLVEAGVVHPRVGNVFELADIREAFEAREAGSVIGKIVIHL